MSDPVVTDAGARQSLWRGILRKPQPSVRFRLTALYGGLFVLAGAGLVTVTNVLYRTFSPSQYQVDVQAIGELIAPVQPPKHLQAVVRNVHGAVSVIWKKAKVTVVSGGPPRNAAPTTVTAFRGIADHIVRANVLVQQNSDSHAVLLWSVVGFGVMAVASIALAWWLSGRALRPLRQMTTTANTISATNLHERLELGGPDDELKDLAATFNRLLGRLEIAFDAQRRFVANASHELRTPLARQRTVAEVALSDPDATVESLRSSYERVIAAGEEQERLIAALLLLARSDRGLARRSPVDLDEIIRRTVASLVTEAGAKDVTVELDLHGSPIAGDQELGERLVANLVDNAIEHNVEGGFVRVSTNAAAGKTLLTVENSGAVLGPEDVERILRPFEQAAGARTNHNGRFGLGLSIVEAIARAHEARLEINAPEAGGLEVTVEFPTATAVASREPTGDDAAAKSPSISSLTDEVS